MGLDEHEWDAEQWDHIPALEYLLPPEIVLRLKGESHIDVQNPTWDDQRRVPYVHDIRMEIPWKLGVLTYDLLHGYSPWERPEYDPRLGELKRVPRASLEVFLDWAARRERILNEELPIREDLSQDCVDALRFMLAKDVDDRPTLYEVSALPWFQGHWADHHPETFRRPPMPRYDV
jgi:serine/threonine protein kinase